MSALWKNLAAGLDVWCPVIYGIWCYTTDVKRHHGVQVMRRIIEGVAYDTETGDMIKQVGFNDAYPDQGQRLYRTRNGAFFVWEVYPIETYRGGRTQEDITPVSDEKAYEWLVTNGNELVEKYFGEMPEGGAAERRMTLRLPNNLATRIEALAKENQMTVSRYIRGCLERCAAVDGKPVVPV
jgi:hypothetical protein